MKNSVYINRELSWLKFNKRVLEEAEKETNPLCERASFISIYQSNLDEFFMVRVGSLIDQDMIDEKATDNKTGMTAAEQINEVLSEVRELNSLRDKIYSRVMSRISEEGISVVSYREMDPDEKTKSERYFDKHVAPLLSPIVIGKRQPFPFLKNKDIYAAAILQKKNGKSCIGIVPCGGTVLPRLVKLNDRRYILLEELILHFVKKLFGEYEVAEKSLIRVTRNADIDADALYDEDIDYRSFMADIIKQRKKLAPVRLECSRKLNENIVKKLCKYLDIDHKYIFVNKAPLDCSFLFKLQDELRQKPELFYPKRIPQKSTMFEDGRSILEQVREHDKLLSYPYDSIRPFLRMLREAANDKSVVSIKMTLYRVAKNSEVVSSLIEAAENGKEVLVLVELKARFDEENNIEWSRRLEEAGCMVIYGVDRLKVHSKLCLITRNIDGNPEYYTQIGTGNYNEKTSRIYTDYSLMTHNQDIGADALNVFNALSKGTTVKSSKELLVAPNCLQSNVIKMIQEQADLAKAGKEAYIGFKINSLTDKKIIDELIKASSAGVKIDMIVRGICCLLPGVKDKTENIRVISVVGRYLEHSRVYIFGKGKDSKVYISSADLMTRNMLRRVEVAAPIHDERIKEQILYMFNDMLADNVQARVLNSNGEYLSISDKEPPVNAQERSYDRAYAYAKQ